MNTVSPYGMTHGMFDSGPYTYAAQTIADALKLGLGRLRFQQDWALIEASKGVYNWSGLDDIIGRANAASLRICCVIRHTPAFYCTGGNQWAADPAAWASFAGRMAARYNGKTTPNTHTPGGFLFLDDIELGNEEFDIAHKANWLAVAKAACPAIVAASPQTRIGPCALLQGDIAGREQFLKDTYAAGLAHYFAYWNIHCYKSGDPQTDNNASDVSLAHIIARLDAVIKAAGDTKPLRITEFGWNIAEVEKAHGFDPTGDPSEAQEAQYYFQVMETMRTSGIVEGFDLFTMNYNPSGTDGTKGKSITCPTGFSPGPAGGGNYYKAFFTIADYIKQYPSWGGVTPPPPPPPPAGQVITLTNFTGSVTITPRT